MTNEEWTDFKNDAWVQSVVDQKGEAKVVSKLEDNLWNVDRNEPTVFAREVVQFVRAGYVRKGDRLVPGP